MYMQYSLGRGFVFVRKLQSTQLVSVALAPDRATCGALGGYRTSLWRCVALDTPRMATAARPRSPPWRQHLSADCRFGSMVA